MKFTIRGRLPGLNEYIDAERSSRYKGAEMKKKYGNDPRKVGADEYWDDRAVCAGRICLNRED